MRLSVLAFATFTFLGLPTLGAEDPAAPKATRTFLTGGIVHSEKMAPVPKAQMPGKLFNLSTMFGATSKAAPRKFSVPDWLAGVWQRNQTTETTRINLATHQNVPPGGTTVAKVTDKFGTFTDAHGVIWQIFDPRKAIGQVDRGTLMDYHRVSTYDLITQGAKTAIVEVTASHLIVNKKTHKIVSSFQDEELNTYTQLADGQLRTDSSVKVFDAHGKPIYLTHSTSLESRVAPFKS